MADAPHDAPAGAAADAARRVVPLWKQKKYRIGAAAVVVAFVASIVGVFALSGDDEPAPASSTTRAPSTTTTAPGPTTTTAYAGPIHPLTGLPDPEGESQGRPALTVKIDNTRNGGAKRGVDQADIVYEEVVEGGITRLAAIFHSRIPSDIGPIRSVRRTDQAIVRPIGGIFVYSGGARYAEESIATAPVNRINESRARGAMYRESARRSPFNLFGRGPDLVALGGDPRPPPPLFAYRGPDDDVVGEPAAHVVVGFARGFEVTWDWDATTGTWLRTFLGAPENVEDGTRIAPTNVVVQVVRYAGGAGSLGAEGVLTGTGEVWVFTDGKVIRGTWSRPDANQPGQLLDAAGAPILLTPGSTWVELPAEGYAVTVT